MIRILSRLVLAAVVLGAGAPASVVLSQPAGPGMMMGGEWDSSRYLESLKSELRITPPQEPAWNEYADTVTSTSQQMRSVHTAMYDAMGTATWQERRDMMNRMFETRQQGFEAVHKAAVKLEQLLDPPQKATAQRLLPGLTYGSGMMMGGHGMMRGNQPGR